MPLFMDFHPDLKLPSDALDQLREGAMAKTRDEFGVRQAELYYDDEGHVYCLLDAPDADAVRKHHEALGVPCGEVHRVHTLT